jgi:CheY-like chemotaxis protein
MRRFRIVVVEDDAVISALVVAVLAELGHDVCGTARTEPEAVDTARRHVPDLMLVDVYLQIGNGVSAMAAILQHIVMPHIFMTGGSRQIIPPQAIVLFKPFGTAGLMAALESVAGQIAAPAGGSPLAQP